MKRYFKGNTPARNKRISKIHKKFKAHQMRWMRRSFARNFLTKKKG